jgi:hypothetical protein
MVKDMKYMVDHQLAHELLIAELVVLTIEYDLKVVPQLKTNQIYTELLEHALIQAQKRLNNVKKQAKSKKLSITKIPEKSTELFIEYLIIQDNLQHSVSYASYALRNNTMAAIKHYMPSTSSASN